jgi:hypothetical protein
MEKHSHVQGKVKIFLPKEALISSLPAGTQLMPDEMKIRFVLTRVSSSYLCSFGGIQMNPLNITNVPPVFGKKIFTVPWTTTDAFGFPIEFFHTFPFQRGIPPLAGLSPPSGKGRLGGISGNSLQTAKLMPKTKSTFRRTEQILRS